MTERFFTLSVNVPESHANAVREAMGQAGGGTVGNYSFCSFSVKGIGRFKPNKDANPFIGQQNGDLEEVVEESITVSNIAASQIRDVVHALEQAHPYEEPNYKITELIALEDI